MNHEMLTPPERSESFKLSRSFKKGRSQAHGDRDNNGSHVGRHVATTKIIERADLSAVVAEAATSIFSQLSIEAVKGVVSA